ncbi:MAG: hypothetical protein PHI73_00475 [Patescibacteria group bacterium]|nr:hypothetical protein [Patescibacteria group bacterium]
MINNKGQKLTKEQFNKGMKKLASSQGRQKLWNYFLSIIKSTKFQKTIADLRKKYDIPKDGFGPSSEGFILPPRQWEYEDPRNRKIRNDAEGLCKEYGLYFIDWQDVIEFVIYYNKLYKPEEIGGDLCMVSDFREEAKEPFTKWIQAADDYSFPVAIRVSPYASERDIIDFIKKSYYLFIKPIQDSYKESGSKIGKLKKRKKSIQDRNDFIYNNRELPRREIGKLVSKKFNELLDYGLIGKIISIEKERRRDV